MALSFSPTEISEQNPFWFIPKFNEIHHSKFLSRERFGVFDVSYPRNSRSHILVVAHFVDRYRLFELKAPRIDFGFQETSNASLVPSRRPRGLHRKPSSHPSVAETLQARDLVCGQSLLLQQEGNDERITMTVCCCCRPDGEAGCV